MIGPTVVLNLYKSDSGTDQIQQIEFLRFLFGTKGLVSCFADWIFGMVSEENVKIVLPILNNNFDDLKKLSIRSIQKLVTKIDSTSVASLVPEDYVRFKEGLLSMLVGARSPCWDPRSLFDEHICLTDIILQNEGWRKMNKDQLIEAQRLFETPLKHFLYSEMMIAWIAEKKPPQEVVTELAETLKLFILGADYISMLNDKCFALGYSEMVSSSLLSAWKRPNHYMSDSTFAGQYNNGSGFYMKFRLSCRSTCEPSQVYRVWFNTPESRSVGHSWGWYSRPSSTLLSDFLRCPNDTVQETVEKEQLVFYGTTKENVHLQLHTDWKDTTSKWAAGRKILNVGCLQFDQALD